MQKIGKYEIVKELGKGGMGTVFQATDPMIGRTVAIKVLKKELRDDKELTQRFLREAKWAGVLSHPNITTIFDLGEHDNSPYIVMEYLTGGDMKTLIEESVPLTLVDKIKIAIDVAEGLAYAHDNDIIHRDIKPENIRILDDRKVKIMDFGIARPNTSTVTQTGMVIGTPAYMSPEQITGKKVDLRTDVFSFGVLLFELLSYKKPFSGETTARLVYEITQEPPRKLRLDNIEKIYQDKLQAIISHCLQKNQTERYRNCREILVDLHEIRAMLVSSQSTEILDFKDLADETVESIVAKGRALMSENQFDRARQVFQRALTKDPDNQATLMSLSELDRKTDTVKQVAILLETAERDLADNDFDKAIEGYQRVLELEPHNSEALHNLQDLQSKLKALSSRVSTTRHTRVKSRNKALIGVGALVVVAVIAFLLIPKGDDAPPPPTEQPVTQTPAAVMDPEPEPQPTEPDPQPEQPPAGDAAAATSEDQTPAPTPAADPDQEAHTALRAELERLTATMQQAKQAARGVDGAEGSADYNKGMEAENAALRLAASDDLDKLRDAKERLTAAAGHFRGAAKSAKDARRRGLAELDRLAADAEKTKAAVPGDNSDRQGEAAWRNAERLLRTAGDHRKAGRLDQAGDSYRDAVAEFNSARAAVERKLRAAVDQARKDMLAARGKLKAGHKTLPNYAAAEALAERASAAEAGGNFGAAQSTYQQAAQAFTVLAETPLAAPAPAPTQAAPEPVVDRSAEDRRAIDAFIDRYVTLFQGENAADLAAMVAWTKKERSDWTVFFDFAEKIRLQSNHRGIDLQGDTATVKVDFTLNYTNKSNSQNSSREVSVNWSLKRDGSGWRINP